MKNNDEASLAVNRRAYHDYSIEEKYEAGIALTGTEIKSIRAGKASIREGYARIVSGEAWLLGVHIAPYDHGNRWNHEPERDRKLLLHREEIVRLGSKVHAKGLTLIPLRLYLKHGRAKVELGLARGKKLWDKREAIAERDAQRDLDRAVRDAQR
jgi:SsrA-binding protein